MDDWAEKVPYTPIPGWYCENAQMELCEEDTLNDKRPCALNVKFEKGGKIYNIGYAGVPVKTGEKYELIVFLKAEEEFTLTAILEGKNGENYGEAQKTIAAGKDWLKVEMEITAAGQDFDGRIAFAADKACKVRFGYTSLLPAETYMGHGLRKDIVQALKDTHPKFLRFPGGCIVEGFSIETAMRFSNTIGPAWERPAHNLMWHYRTTNGFGYHEFLQLCEDTGMEPMYVCNCGMSCQARVEELFDDETVDEFLQEALGALEYALGPVDSKYGAMRAAAGHPEPFKMTYFEIGNENHGPEYNWRYKKFYDALKAAYPDVIYISNTHTERDGLPTEYADEHYYDAPEFFLENDNRFDSYDRSGPKIFLGEYAVNGGNTIASMECALAEAVFLAGVERNQDIVKLTAYAPLLQNSDYTAWKPNLVVFDNHQVYGIPSYHAIAMMAANRGREVLKTETDVEVSPPIYKGIPALMCEKEGLMFKNVKVNGKNVDISQTIYGGWKEEGGVYTMERAENPHPYTGKSETWNRIFEDFIVDHLRRPGMTADKDLMWVAFGNEDLEEYTFEIDVKCEKDNPVTLSVWNYHPETDAGCNEPKDFRWNRRSVRKQVWHILDGKGATELANPFRHIVPETVDLPIDYDAFNTYKIVASHTGYECYINGKLVQKKVHALHNKVYAVATADDEEIILKLIHVGDKATDVQIDLDCDILPEIAVQTLSAPLDAVNSFENKTNVAPVDSKISNGARSFSVTVKENSVNVLRMKKA